MFLTRAVVKPRTPWQIPLCHCDSEVADPSSKRIIPPGNQIYPFPSLDQIVICNPGGSKIAGMAGD